MAGFPRTAAVRGTYFHALFDNDDWRRVFLQELRRTRPGMDTTAPATSYESFQEAQLDSLADLFAASFGPGADQRDDPTVKK